MKNQMIIRRAGERGHANHGWLDTYHTFSFADYYDEDWMGFKTLRVINEDRVAPGKGFDLHGHKDMEILTYVMQGSLRHVDTMGNNEVLKAGEVQMMTAGTGIQHMELNASQTEECHLYQIWILPSHRNLTPSYAQKQFVIPGADPGPTSSSKILIASPDGRSGSLVIHQDAEVWLYRLEASSPEALAKGEGETTQIVIPAKAGTQKACWLQLVSGEIEIAGEKLSTSDAAAIVETSEIKALSKTEMMVFAV